MSANWREEVEAYIRAAARPVDKFGHQPRVHALAEELGQGMAHDADVLFAAAWLHDIGVFIGHRPEDPVELARWDHIPYTVALARRLLVGWGFPMDKFSAVAEAIRTHQPQDDPQTPEAVLLRDADILEQLGAVAVLRTVAKVGRDTRYASYSDAIPALRRALERLPGLLRLEPARRMAVPKVEALRAFLAAVDSEAGDFLF